MRKALIRNGAEWVLLPLVFALALHLCIWLFGAFVAWDFFWLSLFGHRLIFAIICVFVWGSLIGSEIDQANKKSTR